jgi:hypothetical protein
MSYHIHAFEHGRAVVLHQNWDHPFTYERNHRFGIVIEHHGFLEMTPLERGYHAHAKAKRTVLKHVQLHGNRSNCAAIAGTPPNHSECFTTAAEPLKANSRQMTFIRNNK